MQVVLASRNPGKLREFERLLKPLGYNVSSQVDHDIPSTPETGVTYVENSLLKARAVSEVTGSATIADDSGLVVPALGCEPGIYSARYAGPDASDQDNNTKLIGELKDRNLLNTEAFFFCAIVFLAGADDPTPIIATARWHGTIVAEPRGNNGFGYDPHFLVAGQQHTSAELAPETKDQLSHRGQATQDLLTQLTAR